MKLVDPSLVTRGLDPRVHLPRTKMDCRVKPGNNVEGNVTEPHSKDAGDVW
jgi:hypothetical protein